MHDIYWEYKSTGIPDELFIRGKVPMTKAEVRSVTLGKLRLKADSIFVDIGAGTGSVAIEAGLICTTGKIYALEKNSLAVDLIQANAKKFGVSLEVFPGNATENLKKISAFDRAFIGGSGGELEEILTICHKKLSPKGRIVINCIALESVANALNNLKNLSYQNIEVSLISIARSKNVANYTMLEGLNPIYIIAADKD